MLPAAAGAGQGPALPGWLKWPHIHLLEVYRPANRFTTQRLSLDGGSMESVVREIRLKKEFAALYPPLEPGVWQPAAEVGARMLLWQVQQKGTAALGTRLLIEDHFDFRGGWTRGDTELRTRATDPAFNGPA